MIIKEQFLISKTGNKYDCEDIIFLNSNYAAIIDGATARNKRKYNGVSSGRAAAEITYKAIEKLSPVASLREALDIITNEFNVFYKENNIDIKNYADVLTASCVLYSKNLHQIWMIGDCQCFFNNKVYSNKNGIDEHVAFVRSFINQAEILKGHTINWVSENDPGVDYIAKLLTEQFLFQNHIKKTYGEFAYTAIDGKYISEKSVKVLQLNNEITEIILASDGYPKLMATLEKSERALEKALINDPLCIYTNKGVKGLKNGFISYDDRAYLRIIL
ncbi:MAG: hypothetical protein WC292_05745 [Clostridia bacterium]